MSTINNFPITDRSVHHGKLLTVLICTIVIVAIIIAGLFIYIKPESIKVNKRSAEDIQREVTERISQSGSPVSKETEAQVKASISQVGTVSTSSREEIIKRISN